MKQTKHTPGPWTACSYGDTSYVRTHETYIAAYLEHNNAQLISAAPEMLEALDNLTYRLSDLNSKGHLNGLKLDTLIRDAFDAIVKATGGAE